MSALGMRFLVLGGTAWLGGQVAKTAAASWRAAGHQVTCLARGFSGDAPDGALLPALAGDVMQSMEDYGQAKVACEQHVLQSFGPDRALIARAGLIGGPGDVSDRTGYWPLRFARPATDDGAVLIPSVTGLPTQVIDVRDLALWLVDAGSRRIAGIFNATGETIPLHGQLSDKDQRSLLEVLASG